VAVHTCNPRALGWGGQSSELWSGDRPGQHEKTQTRKEGNGEGGKEEGEGQNPFKFTTPKDFSFNVISGGGGGGV
jgi:hypothetical protein